MPHIHQADGKASVFDSSWTPNTYVMDPVLAKLNSATFANLNGSNGHSATFSGGNGGGQDVICHSYNHIVTYYDLTNLTGSFCTPRCSSPFHGWHGNTLLKDTGGRLINRTCFVLTDVSPTLSNQMSLNP